MTDIRNAPDPYAQAGGMSDTLRAAVRVGIDQADGGEAIPADDVYARRYAKYRRMTGA